MKEFAFLNNNNDFPNEFLGPILDQQIIQNKSCFEIFKVICGQKL